MASHCECLSSAKIQRLRIVPDSQSTIDETRFQIGKSFSLDAHLWREDIIAHSESGRNDLDPVIVDEGG
jgi:hypothetical protein